MFQVFSGVSYVCLQVFHLDFAYVCNVFQAFSQVFHVFFCMLQRLHLDVSKVDQVLHMRCMWEAADGMGDIRGGAGPLQVRSLDARSLSVRATF
jgi:hypothetical protein